MPPKSSFSPRLVTYLAFVAFALPGLLPAQEPEAPATSSDIARLVADLESPEFTTRRAAAEQLSRQGARAIAPLLDVARTGSLEASVRAVRALEMIYVTSQDAETIDAAEIALKDLKVTSPPSVASRSHSVLEANYAVSERRAVAEILKLGGVPLDNDNRPISTPPSRRVSTVQIGRNWTGGDAGLKHIERLRELTALRIVGKPENAGLSEEAIVDLLASLPDAIRINRGEAKLGVAGRQLDPMCIVSDLEPGGAAERAGIRERDVITQFGDKPVDTFDTLVELISHKEPGDKVPVGILRDGRPMTIEVTLHGWAPQKPEQPQAPKP